LVEQRIAGNRLAARVQKHQQHMQGLGIKANFRCVAAQYAEIRVQHPVADLRRSTPRPGLARIRSLFGFIHDWKDFRNFLSGLFSRQGPFCCHQ
jgi:hypothetical protein